MDKVIRFIENLFLPVVSIGCFIVSIGDLFDFFHFVAPEHVPMLSFLLLATVLGSLAFIQHKVLELHRHLQELRAETELGQMKHAIDQMDATLLKVLGPEYFVDVLRFFQTAMKEQKVLINDISRFMHHVIQMLHDYQRATFCLTISITAYKDSALETALAGFMKNGGKVKCILVVKSNKELTSVEVQDFRTRQEQFGAQVSLLVSSSIPDGLNSNFIVESKGKIAWEIQVDGEGNIKSGIVTTNKRETTRFCQNFEKLLRLRTRYSA